MSRPAIHPGETQIIQGKRSISDDTALGLGHWFATSDQFWLNLQSAYDICIAARESGAEIGRLPMRSAVARKLPTMISQVKSTRVLSQLPRRSRNEEHFRHLKQACLARPQAIGPASTCATCGRGPWAARRATNSRSRSVASIIGWCTAKAMKPFGGRMPVSTPSRLPGALELQPHGSGGPGRRRNVPRQIEPLIPHLRLRTSPTPT